MKRKRIAILGSTGSIGQQALAVIEEHPDLFEASALTANNSVDLLAQQAMHLNPDSVVIANEAHYKALRDRLAHLPIKVYAGKQALCEVVQASGVDMVLTAMVGFAGLAPTVAAIKAGKAIALANKETLVVAGQLIEALAREHQAPILPVDSEHSAIFQCLVGEENPVRRILLTASGGPLRSLSDEALQQVTPAQALRHPRWDMGPKITIDSASMMNKGFEVIEARWLFGVPAERIEVLVHPESIVHSAVEFVDGAVKAQLGLPDMRLPIQYAFSFPARLTLSGPKLNLTEVGSLTFARPDPRFRCLGLAYEALKQGGNVPCALNAANEVANLAFRQNRLSFMAIPEVIERVMQTTPYEPQPALSDFFDTDATARRKAEELIATSFSL